LSDFYTIDTEASPAALSGSLKACRVLNIGFVSLVLLYHVLRCKSSIFQKNKFFKPFFVKPAQLRSKINSNLADTNSNLRQF